MLRPLVPSFFGTRRRYGRYPYWHCRRSTVMSQLSSPTPRRKSQYRGYDIKMERRDLCWMVTIKPSRPGLAKFPQSSFQTATQSAREALSQAKRRVDDALASSMLSTSSRSGRKIKLCCDTSSNSASAAVWPLMSLTRTSMAVPYCGRRALNARSCAASESSVSS